MIELNPEAALYESRMRIARANARASLLASLGVAEPATPPAPMRRRDYRPLLDTVELKQAPAQSAFFESPRAA